VEFITRFSNGNLFFSSTRCNPKGLLQKHAKKPFGSSWFLYGAGLAIFGPNFGALRERWPQCGYFAMHFYDKGMIEKDGFERRAFREMERTTKFS